MVLLFLRRGCSASCSRSAGQSRPSRKRGCGWSSLLPRPPWVSPWPWCC